MTQRYFTGPSTTLRGTTNDTLRYKKGCSVVQKCPSAYCWLDAVIAKQPLLYRNAANYVPQRCHFCTAKLVFNLPSYESCCKSVKRWVKRADIDKHISWHCARHSFAVNILNNGANIKTVASLLGLILYMIM